MNRIPRRVPLGLNLVIQVKLAPPSVIAGIVGPNTSACWDAQNNTIWIDKTLSLQRKWKAYRHELFHAVVDSHEIENGGV